MFRFLIALSISALVMAAGCKPTGSNKNNNDSPTDKTSPKQTLPNLRTGLTPDPPDLKEGEKAFSKEEPKNKDGSGKLVGTLQGLDEIPLAYITFKGTSEWCSGILVTEGTAQSYIVVTAAHCFWDDNKRLYEPKDVFILNRAGGWDRAEHVFYERSDIDVAEYKDIGLIRLKKTPNIKTYPTIRVAARAVPTDANAQATWETKGLKPGTEVYSWGYTSRRWIKRETVEMTGAQIWGDAAGRDMRQWVIPTKNAQAYGGDSGGPLLMKFNGAWHLVGVLQGYKPEGLYTKEHTITFTWIDRYMQNIWDANADITSTGIRYPEQLDATALQNY